MSVIFNSESSSAAQLQRMIGGVLLLSQHSPLHRLYSVAEWQQRILPAFKINQFCYYEDADKNPVAFCNWVLVSAKNRDELLSGRDLFHSDWQSGQHIFIPEMIAPFGHARKIVNDLRHRVFRAFKGQKICTVRGKIRQKNETTAPKIQWFTI